MNEASKYSSIINNEIVRSIKKSYYFKINKSYYKINDEIYNIKNEDLSDEFSIDDIWEGKGKYQKIPKVDIIGEFGRQLKVDTILVFYADIYEVDANQLAGVPFLRRFHIYLIDTKTKQVVSIKSTSGDAYDIGTLVSKLIKKYKELIPVTSKQ